MSKEGVNLKLKSALIIAFLFVAIMILPVTVVSKKPTPEPEPTLQLNSVNIITAEPNGDGRRLHVWGYADNSYENIWTAESVGYDSVAIGDVDDDGKREIVAITSSKVTEGRGKSGTSWYNVFFDVYKEGESGVWLSSEGVREDRVFWSNEITIADLDGDSVNEIVMITANWVVVHRFLPGVSPGEGSFEIVGQRSSFIDGRSLSLRSVTVANIDGDPFNEILVSATDRGEENLGYLLIFQDAGLDEEFIQINMSARLSDQSLRVGNLDGEGYPEIVSTGFRQNGDLYQPFLFVWKYNGGWGLIVEKSIWPETSNWPWVHAAVGELSPSSPGEEIVLVTSNPDQVILYALASTGDRLDEVWTLTLDYFSVTINNVIVANSDNDEANEIIISGGGRRGRNSGTFYLEVFDSDGSREWDLLGGEKREHTEVWNAAVG